MMSDEEKWQGCLKLNVTGKHRHTISARDVIHGSLTNRLQHKGVFDTSAMDLGRSDRHWVRP
jgi:hypothetical protein